MKKLVSGVLAALLMVGSILLTGCFDGQATTQPGNGDQMTTVQMETENQDEITQEEMTIEEETTEEETTEE